MFPIATIQYRLIPQSLSEHRNLENWRGRMGNIVDHNPQLVTRKGWQWKQPQSMEGELQLPHRRASRPPTRRGCRWIQSKFKLSSHIHDSSLKEWSYWIKVKLGFRGLWSFSSHAFRWLWLSRRYFSVWFSLKMGKFSLKMGFLKQVFLAGRGGGGGQQSL